MTNNTRRSFLRAAAGTAVTLGASPPAQAQSHATAASSAARPADLILKNGKIITVARVSNAGNQRVAPEQAISRAEALRCATVNCAYLTFDEHKKGSLEPGKLADLAVLTADPLGAEEASLRDISAAMTMVGGRIVHETREWNG